MPNYVIALSYLAPTLKEGSDARVHPTIRLVGMARFKSVIVRYVMLNVFARVYFIVK